MTEETSQRDYRDTVFLPKTDFPMKAGLPQKEPGIAARWEQIGLYDQLRAARKGREKFILHDGPPYANGDMHIGHALNHILKDMVCRTQNLLGKDAPYVPGWDCHGLPIEWKVEELYRNQMSGAGALDMWQFNPLRRAQRRTHLPHGFARLVVGVVLEVTTEDGDAQAFAVQWDVCAVVGTLHGQSQLLWGAATKPATSRP